LESLEFIVIIAIFAVILLWYLHNARTQSDGLRGLLAMRDDPETTKPASSKSASNSPSYRVKSRIAPNAHEPRPNNVRDQENGVSTPKNTPSAYHALDEAARMRRKFRRQDEARYRVKDKKPED
jgi:hypothetical protein